MIDQSLGLRLFGILIPIYGVIATGYFYARKHRPEMAVANRLNMDIFVPALVFSAMVSKSFDVATYAPLALGGFLVIAVCGLIAWLASIVIGVQPKTLVPPMLFNNAGNIGLPLAVLAWGEAALPAAVILFMVENTLHFSFGARLLDPRARVTELWRIPVVFATLASLAVAILGIPIWNPALMAIKMLGDISVPLLLFSLGVRMTDINIADWKLAVGAALVRPLVGMAAASVVSKLLGLEGRDVAMLLVFGALPPAILNFLFAERYKQEPQRVASIVLVGNLSAFLMLPLALIFVL